MKEAASPNVQRWMVHTAAEIPYATTVPSDRMMPGHHVACDRCGVRALDVAALEARYTRGKTPAEIGRMVRAFVPKIAHPCPCASLREALALKVAHWFRDDQRGRVPLDRHCPPALAEVLFLTARTPHDRELVWRALEDVRPLRPFQLAMIRAWSRDDVAAGAGIAALESCNGCEACALNALNHVAARNAGAAPRCEDCAEDAR